MTAETLLADRIRAAAADRIPLRIVGGDTRFFYGREVRGEALSTADHTGVVDYEPSELVITVRAGALVSEVEALLAAKNQMLAFEPPVFGPASTVGGMVATGLAGSRRPFTGAVRDSILGATILDGLGRRLRFGGTVFKNVAGFDGFRLMAGAQGALGLILDVSLRVAPKPRAEATRVFDMDWPAAQARLAELLRRPLPLSGAAHHDGRLYLRLSGPEAAVREAETDLGGEADDGAIWPALTALSHPALKTDAWLWRLSVPRMAYLDLPGRWLMDWAGAQRWLVTDAPNSAVRTATMACGGHATRFCGPALADDPFAPMPAPLFALHQRLKAALDPHGILNPGRLYEGL